MKKHLIALTLMLYGNCGWLRKFCSKGGLTLNTLQDIKVNNGTAWNAKPVFMPVLEPNTILIGISFQNCFTAVCVMRPQEVGQFYKFRLIT